MTEQAFPGILATIGDTPLVQLQRYLPDSRFRVFAKMERFNPGGSIKDRSALSMILGKLRTGELVPGRSTIVESSSGNLAIGIAQICRYFGLRFICVVDARTTSQNLSMLRALRAEVEVVTEADAPDGNFLPVRKLRVKELVERIPDAYSPDQYSNPLNPQAHVETMREIAEALDGRVDYLFCAASTCGTLRGCAEYVRRTGMSTAVVAVDAVGSAIFGDTPRRRLLPGHGASVRPALWTPDAADEVIHVNDMECVVACRKLADREAILAGGSSGAALAALESMADRIPDGANVALVLADGGDRYLDTIYSDEWVARHFGEISHLWKEHPIMSDAWLESTEATVGAGLC
ncbi:MULTISPECIES: 2,3-diaminopropionate biosynthesis protein SbnA [Streptomyces]|uniref:N-(2-amino-2-carboxyethyl)-L-glutamate synthase n=3 Tax=Streptomyces TaxID=1883 RepID=A0A3Q9FXJ5_STRLT|nr:2,3-diaminopropionate biosynthesis protein SbnA [Streptomyces luteoverticillatus]AZQ72651.1 2,3-diaminopropionate biosynthesis protein SbnA [Streptomyces luteoverticillatus]